MQIHEEIIFLEEKIEELEEVLSCREKFDESFHWSEGHLRTELQYLKKRLEQLTSNSSNANNTYMNSISVNETLKRLHMKHRESNKHDKELRLLKKNKNKKTPSPRRMRELLRFRDK